jgi:hypothetical protein
MLLLKVSLHAQVTIRRLLWQNLIYILAKWRKKQIRFYNENTMKAAQEHFCYIEDNATPKEPLNFSMLLDQHGHLLTNALVADSVAAATFFTISPLSPISTS